MMKHFLSFCRCQTRLTSILILILTLITSTGSLAQEPGNEENPREDIQDVHGGDQDDWRFVGYAEFLESETEVASKGENIAPKLTPELKEWASRGIAINPETGAYYESNLSMDDLDALARDLMPTGISMASHMEAEEVERMDEGLDSKRVLGSDGRRRRFNTAAFPWRAMGWISTSAGNCTGTQIGPRHILTSAHCVVQNGKPKRNIRYFPGKNGSQSPYGYRNAFWIFVPQGWLSRGWARYDYAMIVLPRNNSTRWFGFWKYRFRNLKNKSHWNFGYPGDKRPYPSLWGMSCPIKNVFTRVVLHQCDSAGGQSGSALYKYNSGNRTVVAIHKGGYSKWKNRAVRINSTVYSNLVNWKRTFSCSSGCCGNKACEDWYR